MPSLSGQTTKVALASGAQNIEVYAWPVLQLGITAGGILVPVKVAADGSMEITATIDDTGLATSGHQVTQITAEQAILAKLIAAPATEAKQDTGNTSLASILAKLSADPATQTTLAAVLAKIIAAPATEAKQDTGNTSLASILAKLSADPATQTTLAAILAKIIAAPSTEAKQDTGNTSLASLVAGIIVTKIQGAANVNVAQITTSTSSGTLAIARATRRGLLIRNTDAAITVYIDTGTASATSFPLKAGESVPVTGVSIWHVIADSGTPVVAIIDEYD